MEEFDRLLARAAEAEQAGRYDEALATVDRALTMRPDHAGLHRQRGGVLVSLRRREDAIAAYSAALECAPDPAAADPEEAATHQLALKRRMECHLALNHPLATVADATALLVLNPEDWMTRHWRAQAFVVLGLPHAAHADLTLLIEGHTGPMGTFYADRARANAAMGRQAAKEADLEKAGNTVSEIGPPRRPSRSSRPSRG